MIKVPGAACLRWAISLATACLLTAGLFGPALAAETPPQWERRPSLNEIMEHYPPVAAAHGLEGRAMVRCEVRLDHTVENCTVVEQTPAGQGFGEATSAHTPDALHARHAERSAGDDDHLDPHPLHAGVSRQGLDEPRAPGRVLRRFRAGGGVAAGLPRAGALCGEPET